MISSGYVIEGTDDWPALVVTGPWSEHTAAVLERHEAKLLILNRARGFREPDLRFLRRWPLHGLHVIARDLRDLGPIGTLADSLVDLSVQADRRARLDLSGFERLEGLTAPYLTVRDTLDRNSGLRFAVLMSYTATDLQPLAGRVRLEGLQLERATKLESLAGIEHLGGLSKLGIELAPRLHNLSAVSSLAHSLEVLRLVLCRSLGRLDDLSGLTTLRSLEIVDCGELASLAPLASLAQLEMLRVWGETRVLDGDLSALRGLPLRELRMRSRRSYHPSVAELRRELGLHA